MVRHKGIKIDPNKVKAILDMLYPRIEKEVRSFLGYLNYKTQFISQLSLTYKLIF
jgi:hypothetical protein